MISDLPEVPHATAEETFAIDPVDVARMQLSWIQHRYAELT
jgi:hypothetical protein